MAKFLKFFDNNVQRSTYELSEQYVSPYVSAIKGTNGGGAPRYNIPSDILCVLTLKDNSTVYITGENTIDYDVLNPYHEEAISAIVNNRCTNIGVAGFSNFTYLEHISLPNTLRKIENDTFNNCGVKELIIPEGVTDIDMNAICFCSNLERLTFPSSLQSLNQINFLDECNKLREIEIMGTTNLTTIISLRYIPNESDVTLYVDSSLVDAYKANRDSINGLYKILPLQE